MKGCSFFKRQLPIGVLRTERFAWPWAWLGSGSWPCFLAKGGRDVGESLQLIGPPLQCGWPSVQM